MWFCWDIGENINSALKLKKGDWHRQINKDTNEPEYLINLKRKILKRTRKKRGQITNFKETAEWADIVLRDLKDEDLIFPFGYTSAKKFLSRAVRITKATCMEGERITWKDFRSSMAMYLLGHEWTTDEINGRLGHRLSSRELDKYVDARGVPKHKPKKKLYDSSLQEIKEELEAIKKREKLTAMRMEELKNLVKKSLVSEIKAKKK